MMKSGLLCLALVAAATPAEAQMTWTDKGFFNLDGGIQAGSSDITVNTPFELYQEIGTIASTQDVKGGGFFNVAAGYKVWRNLAVGLGYTYTSGNSDAAIAASVPDPLVHENHRAVIATANDVGHSENQIHITATWMIPVTDKIDVGLNFGPTFFSTSTEIPNGLTVTEPGATVDTISVGEVDESAVGLHLGIDVTYMMNARFGFMKARFGFGGMARFTRGSSDLDNSTENLKFGGFQIGGGLRVRF